jgi:hypothetical protein
MNAVLVLFVEANENWESLIKQPLDDMLASNEVRAHNVAFIDINHETRPDGKSVAALRSVYKRDRILELLRGSNAHVVTPALLQIYRTRVKVAAWLTYLKGAVAFIVHPITAHRRTIQYCPHHHHIPVIGGCAKYVIALISVEGDKAKGSWVLYIMYRYPRTGQAMFWIQSVFEPEYFKENGKWKFRAIRCYERLGIPGGGTPIELVAVDGREQGRSQERLSNDS